MHYSNSIALACLLKKITCSYPACTVRWRTKTFSHYPHKRIILAKAVAIGTAHALPDWLLPHIGPIVQINWRTNSHSLWFGSGTQGEWKEEHTFLWQTFCSSPSIYPLSLSLSLSLYKVQTLDLLSSQTARGVGRPASKHGLLLDLANGLKRVAPDVKRVQKVENLLTHIDLWVAPLAASAPPPPPSVVGVHLRLSRRGSLAPPASPRWGPAWPSNLLLYCHHCARHWPSCPLPLAGLLSVTAMLPAPRQACHPSARRSTPAVR